MSNGLEKSAVLGILTGGSSAYPSRIGDSGEYRKETVPYDVSRLQERWIGPVLGATLGEGGEEKAQRSYQDLLETAMPWADRFGLTEGSDVRSNVKNMLARTSKGRHVDDRARWYSKRLMGMGDESDYLAPSDRAEALNRLAEQGHVPQPGQASKQQARKSLSYLKNLEPTLSYMKEKGVAPGQAMNVLAEQGLLENVNAEDLDEVLKMKELNQEYRS